MSVANQATQLVTGASLEVAAEVVECWDEVETLHGPDESQTLKQGRDGMFMNGDRRERFQRTDICSPCFIFHSLGH